ncbi:hypothetical protein [Aliarcobacter butzleri]|uniref:hypothetical protein n=1 Tax=Aliarcobacter butzleri TaxID=28197 RepID=UPI001269E1C7|nr:hypothetical protein [Aliarcobacter butzleri]
MNKTLNPTKSKNCFFCQSLSPDKLPIWNGNKIIGEEINNLGGATCSNKESEHYDFHFIFKEDSKELLCSCFN